MDKKKIRLCIIGNLKICNFKYRPYLRHTIITHACAHTQLVEQLDG